VIYDSSLSTDAKLSSILLNGDWFWPRARSEDLVEIQNKLSDRKIGQSDIPFLFGYQVKGLFHVQKHGIC
jgi:hypothetical protein